MGLAVEGDLVNFGGNPLDIEQVAREEPPTVPLNGEFLGILSQSGGVIDLRVAGDAKELHSLLAILKLDFFELLVLRQARSGAGRKEKIGDVDLPLEVLGADPSAAPFGERERFEPLGAGG